MQQGCSSVGLHVARSVSFGAEGLEAASLPTEDSNGSRFSHVDGGGPGMVPGDPRGWHSGNTP